MVHRLRAVPIAALMCAASTFAQPAAPPERATEELICERPMKIMEWLVRDQVSSDLGKVVRVFERNVLVNCAPLGPPADELLLPALSPDGQHVLRAGRQAKSWYVWLDAEQIAGPFDGVRRSHFAADGRVVFAAKRAQAWTWFVDGKEQSVTTPALKDDGGNCNGEMVGLWNPDHPATRPAVERCWSGLLALTRDRVAYSVKRTDGWHLVVDGQVGPPFERILQITFSPDGARLAYLGLRKELVVPVVDGKEEPAHDSIEGLRFSADSKRVAYLAIDTTKGVTGQVVADGVPSRSYPAVSLDLVEQVLRANVGYSRLGFWLSPPLLPVLTGASGPLFRADGKVIYSATTATGQTGIWVEGADQPLFPAADPHDLVQSEVGDHIGWLDWNGTSDTWVGYVDGQPRGSAPGLAKKQGFAEQLTISRDGSRLAFVHVVGGVAPNQLATHAPRRVVATGLEDKVYDALVLNDLRFSDDGKHLAYVVIGAKGVGAGQFGNGFVVLDGVPGHVYSAVLPETLRFVGADTVRYVAVVQDSRKAPRRYYRVTQTAP